MRNCAVTMIATAPALPAMMPHFGSAEAPMRLRAPYRRSKPTAMAWPVNPADIVATASTMGKTVTMVGTTAFTAMGLLMGGTLGAELILGLANLIWFILLGAATFVAVGPELGDGSRAALTVLPSVALTESLIAAFDGRLAWYPLAVLIVWGAVCAVAATRLFRFEAKGD